MRSAVSDRRRDQISPGQRRRADLDERAALLALDSPLSLSGSSGTLTMSIMRTTGTVGTTNHSDRHIDGAGGR
jgi:hypothetical protein